MGTDQLDRQRACQLATMSQPKRIFIRSENRPYNCDWQFRLSVRVIFQHRCIVDDGIYLTFEKGLSRLLKPVKRPYVQACFSGVISGDASRLNADNMAR